MRRPVAPHPDQLPLQFDSVEAFERAIEARVAERCQAESFYWRFRLVVIETILFSTLVAAAGFTLGQPTSMVIRATLLIGASCFLTGLMLLGLSAFSTKLWSHVRRGKAA